MGVRVYVISLLWSSFFPLDASGMLRVRFQFSSQSCIWHVGKFKVNPWFVQWSSEPSLADLKSNSISTQHFLGRWNLGKTHLGGTVDWNRTFSICSPGWIRTIFGLVIWMPAKKGWLKRVSVLVPMVTCRARAEHLTWNRGCSCLIRFLDCLWLVNCTLSPKSKTPLENFDPKLDQLLKIDQGGHFKKITWIWDTVCTLTQI